jgi:hypothetical protein
MMSTAGTFWFILWRMIVWGLGLALGSGAAYGTIVGLPFFPFGLIFGPLLGAMYGARAGLALGILEGVVLLAVTLLVRWRGTFKDVNRYRRTAGWACAVVCVLASASFFELAARRSGTSFVTGPGYDVDDVVFLLVLIVGPSLVAAGGTWWAGRRVAERYVEALGGPADRGFARASCENPDEKIDTAKLPSSLLWPTVLLGLVFGTIVVVIFGTTWPAWAP